ncbi:hypothetical protein TeGR_g9820 [Tetraparma gracilis]|uniref:Uncharacterized protein n=1 Tax=Tetraparma gracilis TaxID=2962635 RepID=A0ABQ6MRS8_9STRA|nr:hypothetical protein TeGR_g9820 [Tetraparma gracilis]
MSEVAPDPTSQRALDRAKWIAANISDKTLRDAFIRAVADKSLDYSDAERQQIEEGLKMEAEVNQSSKLKPIKVSTPLLDKAVAMTSKDGQHNIVQSSAIVRAPLMDVLAYMFCMQQEVKKIMDNEEKNGTRTLCNKILENKSEHSYVFQYGLRSPKPFSHRDWVSNSVCDELENGDFVISIASTEHAAATTMDNTIRATATRLLRFAQVTPTVTRFIATVTFDLCGSIPRVLSSTITTPGAARSPLSALGYFLQIKETAELDAAGQDARALGQLLVHEMEPVRTKKHPEELEAKLHIFFYRTTVLRELGDVHLWFLKMMFEILRNLPHRPRTTEAKLADFTERDAVITGRAMKMLMLSNATPDAAVDEWILTFPALQELESAHAFFRPFMNEIAKHILSIADFGLKMRLFSGAGLSVFDIISDVYMIIVFLGSEETRGVAHVNIACVALSLLMQLLLVSFVNRKRSWRRIAREMLYVLLFIKPGIDAARVAAGNENDDGLATMDPLQELVFSKAIEMAMESIPCAIIQSRAFIISEDRSRAALASIIIGCCTTGFAAATMWFDWDTSPKKRKGNPLLAGAVPDTGRGPFFALLVLSGALQVAAKGLSSALLFIVSPVWLLAYMVGDHLLYQLYLAARGDYLVFMPGAGVALSFLVRLLEKLISDFTSCGMIRSPLMMHSAYFLFNQLATHASVFVSVKLYVDSGNDHLPHDLLWAGAGCVFSAWALIYLTLVAMVKKDFRRTFYNTDTISDYVRKVFYGSDDDGDKFNIFYFHESKWSGGFREDVMAWTHENWARWKDERPAWFLDEENISTVPDEFIPVSALAELNAAQGGQRRRSSLGLVSVRESARRVSISGE